MEREHKKKQEALTLEDTKEQISNLETKLTQLKEEKHQLFHTLKKVQYKNYGNSFPVKNISPQKYSK